ncbi:Uncharacterized protein BC88300_01677 [Bacillus cytotoxicus]|nr:Uncharacterized protein BC88300_01677 [Bacillus cytotoxicus]
MSCRIQGVGRKLLHRCLNDIRKNDYGYAIICQARSIELYEESYGVELISVTIR